MRSVTIIVGGLEQEHPPRRVLGQTRREHAPRGTAADDDNVIGHVGDDGVSAATIAP